MPILITLLAIFGFGLLLAFWAIFIERNWFVLRRVELKVLPPGHDPIKILHISDMHLHPRQTTKIRWVQNLAAEKPDFIINTGDNMGHQSALPAVAKSLQKLLTTPGVFVFGGNDYKGPVFKNPFGYLVAPSKPKPARMLAAEKLTAALETGWVDLNNNCFATEVSGTKLGFLGLNDAHEQLDNVSEMKSAISQIADADLLIGVTHAPYHRSLQSFGLHGARVVFAGHTHGGQVCLPGSKALTTNCDLPTENAKGVSDWIFDGSDLTLHVSAGIGTSIFAPFRLFCRPEASLVTLTS